jgi:hypothetical protein
VGKQSVLLKDHIYTPPVRPKDAYILPVNKHPPCVRCFKPGDNPQNRSFAAAGRTQQRNKFPPANGKIKPPQNLNRTKTFLDSLKTQNFPASAHPLSVDLWAGKVNATQCLPNNSEFKKMLYFWHGSGTNRAADSRSKKTGCPTPYQRKTVMA